MTTPEDSAVCSPQTKDIGRRLAVPIIHTRGTHYDIGFDIGRTFSGLIQEYVDTYRPLNETYLPLYETETGRKIYEETLGCVEEQFPGYLREIRGTADGANVPFHKLFLMHLDDIVPNVANVGVQSNALPVGCSTIVCNQPGQEILGHNEDALGETLNHWYLVAGHVLEPGCKEEHFTSLSYAGFLPGYTMGYNHHGLVYTINTLSAANLRSGKTPRYFLTRALLAAENYVQAQQILRNEGFGAAEGFSVNMTFLTQEGDRMFHNAEIGPCDLDAAQSQLNILTVSPGENTFHCNKYLRLKIPEVKGLIIDSSVRRMDTICKYPPPKSRQDVINILSDQTDNEYRVYQEIKKDDYVKTIATGIFDCIERTWSIYTDKPNCTEPILVIPLQLCDEPTTIAAV
ncbi:acyl-coenzyme A:6-aminopenicillanic-acid-acyltransferase 40 kDa form isoform X2 [Osmia bicornis bicornis]|nr:acyl-coenzyme A:6-aminopenicillanic-acid-acyltransferase 40 kDa form isoform X2 [Osmia bicornis bicornis]XP_029055559.1 acyl-coenzyme A:6-aminopenicillanic-acid-acyltransferase 40 kDa form isoform X2 [Osmia bicornis bicornis]XP_029055560.1 acyl-coenzyme A:6-aminopenicillanic-acid-acyltransferase 40 kDa form isoform X2 [Osmia bicornis bicornis]